MQRQCAIDQIRDHIKTDLIGVGRNSATPVKENVILLPVGGLNNNKSLPDKNATYKWGRQLQDKINNTYKSQIYGNVIDLDNVSNPKGTLLHINIPSKLIDAYEKVDKGSVPPQFMNIRFGGLGGLFNKKANTKVHVEKKQEVYFKRLIAKLTKELAKLNRKLVEEPYNEELQAKILEISNKVNNIQSNLSEYYSTDNRQLLINLANDLLDEIDANITTWEEQFNEGNLNLNIDNFESIIDTLNIFREFNGTRDRADTLFKRLRPKDKKSILTEYVLNLVKKSVNPNVDEQTIDYDAKDIFVGEKNFGTLADIPNYLGKTVGFLIKEAQANISIENRKSYDKVKKHTDILEKYNKTHNIPQNKAYDVFIQNMGKTTVLTKEFTTEFYNKLKEANKLEQDEKIRVKREFAKYNPEKRRWEPKDMSKYSNPNYTKIQNTPELKQFYDFIQETNKKIFQELPIARDVNFLPNVAERTIIDILKSNSSIKNKFKDVIENITQVYDANEQPDAFISDENLLADDIPLKYIGSLNPELKSNDLGKSMLIFMQFANEYKHMSEVLPKTRLLQEEIKARKFLSNTDNSLYISGEDSNIYKMTEDFINMQVKNQKKFNEKLGNFNYGKYIDFGLRYTSLLRIGLNPFNAITNVVVGSLGNIIEGFGGRYYTLKEFNNAQNTFFKEVWNKDSKVNKMIDIINPLMELEDYENIANIQIGSKDYKEKIKNLMYSPQRIGEKMMQTSTMIASMKHDKVTTKNGDTISLWDAFNEDGTWNEELMGYNIDQHDIFKITNKIQRINQMIHGRYSAKDAAALSQYSLFRAAFQFKKWIPAAFEARLQGKRFDERLGYETEGRYITLWNSVIKKAFTNPFEAVTALIGPLLAQKKLLESGKYTELEIYNMRKNMIELTLILASYLMYMGLDDDEENKNNGWYKFTMSQLDRISGDLLYFYNPADINKGLVGVPMTKTTEDLIKAIKSLTYAFGVENAWYLKDAEYKSGPRKGEHKTIASLLDILPGVKPIVDVYRQSKKDVPYIAPK